MDVNFLGNIDGVKYTNTAVIVTASETRLGYKKKDGTVVPDELLTFRFIFKPYFRKYIAEHFGAGMLVKIKGCLLPYAKDGDGKAIEGFSIIGQTIDRASYPSNKLRIEKRMLRESYANSTDSPNLEEFASEDF